MDLVMKTRLLDSLAFATRLVMADSLGRNEGSTPESTPSIPLAQESTLRDSEKTRLRHSPSRTTHRLMAVKIDNSGARRLLDCQT